MQQNEVCPPPLEPSSAIPGGEKTSRDTAEHSPERIKIEMPLDIAKSLLRQNEWEKLQKYVASYLGKHWQP